MNFFGSRRGIQQEGIISPFSSSTSSSSSSYHNHHHQQQQQHQQQKRPNTSTELMLMDSSSAADCDGMIEKEHMFDKVVTPSDVGKLNRLVIPKQHAEKYFPLDSTSNDKGGLLLNFEDSNGKPWRFRYSYWNSSQSYVMTKGWSRFVKEKKLDAGDIVSFHRGSAQSSKHRLFIDWRRRTPDHMMNNHFMLPPSNARLFPLHPNYPTIPYSNIYGIGNSNTTSSSNMPNYYMMSSTNFSPFNNVMRSGAVAIAAAAPQGIVEPRVFNSVPVVQGKVAAKRLRLFGVNMDCPMDHPDIIPTTTTTNYSHFSSEESSEKGKSFDLDI